MSKVLVRHGLSEANNRNNIGNLAFANAAAPLMAEGIQQGHTASEQLVSTYGISYSKQR